MALIGTYDVDGSYRINGKWVDGYTAAVHYLRDLRKGWPEDTFILAKTAGRVYEIHNIGQVGGPIIDA